jgi:hypothetical protein
MEGLPGLQPNVLKNMRRRITSLLAALILSLSASAVGQPERPDVVLWVDHDFKTIPEPKARDIGYYESFFDNDMAERWKRATDIPRWVRLAAGAPKQALNVNALDEVPDSSWYTNRHALRHMTTKQLIQGPNRGDPPDLSHATIINAKLEGVTPGLRLTDNKGTDYMIKFDNNQYPELQSGAEVIATKILYASGYNVPENYIAYLDPGKLEIKTGLEIGTGKSKRPFTRDDLTKLLQKAAQRSDGTYRVLASKILEGKPKGPFTYVGLRSDDPNDLIQHEHRRELRGLRVIASWINHWDVKEKNTLDMYIEEGGRKFLRHFLIDFGSSLGGGKSPDEYFHGREYAFDTTNMFKEIFTFGLYVTPDEKSAPVVFPEVGIFSAKDFDPGDWKPSFQAMPFDNMTSNDAVWATRVILSFSEDDIASIVKTAEYSNPKVTEYMVSTLIQRRQLIARHWLKDVNPIGRFTLDMGSNGLGLRFSDFALNHDQAGPAEYRYEITIPSANGDPHTEKGATMSPRIPLGQAAGGETRIRIWTLRNKSESSPVTIYVRNQTEHRGIRRIERS